MICFQNFRSLMSWTTKSYRIMCKFQLWFAFKIFDLWCREQPRPLLCGSQPRCDLLSKFSIFDVVNNHNFPQIILSLVVICFQNFRSLMSWTTTLPYNEVKDPLWFAFKIFDLWCREQRLLDNITQTSRCDLLSKFSIFDVVNNSCSTWSCY